MGALDRVASTDLWAESRLKGRDTLCDPPWEENAERRVQQQ